jgi:hypothetical protein
MQGAAMMDANNWLICIDDLLCARLMRCTACGCAGVVWGEIVPMPRLVFTCVLCQTCDRKREDAIALLTAVVPRRYGQEVRRS